MLTLAIFCIRLLTVLFFVGLVGCSAVVVFSWISIFTSGFSNDDIEAGERHGGPHQPPVDRPGQCAYSTSIAPFTGQWPSR